MNNWKDTIVASLLIIAVTIMFVSLSQCTQAQGHDDLRRDNASLVAQLSNPARCTPSEPVIVR